VRARWRARTSYVKYVAAEQNLTGLHALATGHCALHTGRSDLVDRRAAPRPHGSLNPPRLRRGGSRRGQVACATVHISWLV